MKLVLSDHDFLTHQNLIICTNQINFPTYLSSSQTFDDVVLTGERGVILDSLSVDGAVVVNHSWHYVGVFLRYHPGSSRNVTRRGTYTAGSLVSRDEFEHLGPKTGCQAKHSSINRYLFVLEYDTVTRRFWGG